MHSTMNIAHARPRRVKASAAALRDLNLNLLLSLDALLREVNVTKAAHRLGVTQSAMSHSLRQLRELLGDPLLVRGKGGMVLTPRAAQLAVPLRQGLTILERALLEEPAFDPLAARRRFVLAAGDLVAVRVLPKLLEITAAEAPNVDLDVRSFELGRIEQQLESGEMDVLLALLPDQGSGLRTKKLFTEGFACVVRDGHPTVRRRLDLDRYTALPHLLISPRGEGAGTVDTALALLGRRRRIALRVSWFLTAPLLVATSDLILTAPRTLAEQFAKAHGLRVLEPPLELPTFDVHLVWHERWEEDPAHRWLREAVVRAVGPAKPRSGEVRFERRQRSR